MPFEEVDTTKPVGGPDVNVVGGPASTADVEAQTPGLVHDTELPRASERMGPIGRLLFSAATILPGAMMIALYSGLITGGAVADGADVSTGPDADTTAALVCKVSSGVAWVICGVLIWWGGIVRPAIAAGVALILALLGWVIF